MPTRREPAPGSRRRAHGRAAGMGGGMGACEEGLIESTATVVHSLPFCSPLEGRTLASATRRRVYI